MVKTDIFKNLKFEKTNAEFKDGRKIVSAYAEGSFTREQIKTKLQQLADGIKLKDKNAYIDVAIHYSNPHAWLPSVAKHVTQPVAIFDPTDSDTTQDYDNIDGVMFQIILLDNEKLLETKHHRPENTNKGETTSEKKVRKTNTTGFMFGKKK